MIAKLPLSEAAVACAFLAFAAASLLLTGSEQGLLIWPANAVAAALLVRLPSFRWTWALLLIAAAAAPVELAATQHRVLPAVALIAVSLGEIATTTWLLRRWFGAALPDITLMQGIQMWMIFGLALPSLWTLPGSAITSAAYGIPMGTMLKAWWLSAFIGTFLCAPSIYLYSRKMRRRLISRPYVLGNLATAVVCIAMTYATIRYASYSLALIGFSLTFAALRLGALGSALLSAFCGLFIVALWIVGIRPQGSIDLQVALAATLLAPVAVGLATDDRRRALRAARLGEQRFRESLEHSPIGVIITDLDGKWVMTNAVFQRMLGYFPDESPLLKPETTVPPEELDDIAQRLRMLKSGEMGGYTAERRYRHKKGHWIWTRVAVSLARDEDGHPLHYIGYVESLEVRLRVERELADERERLKTTLRTIAEPVLTTDVEGRITYANAAGEALLNQSLGEIANRRLDEVAVLTDPDTSKTTAWMLARCMAHGEAVRRELPCVLHRPDGSVRFISETASPVLGADGQIRGFALVLHDETDDYSRGRELSRRANYDQLTGLVNRFEFDRRLHECLEHARCLDHPATLLMIDLDRFKDVNDRGGHAAGDAVLRAVAKTLLDTVRDTDVVARPGGDEFAIVLVRCVPARGLTLARKVLDAVLALRVPWGSEQFEVGASVGVAALTPDIKTATAWVAAADGACYEAKRAGRSQLRMAGGSVEVADFVIPDEPITPAPPVA